MRESDSARFARGFVIVYSIYRTLKDILNIQSSAGPFMASGGVHRTIFAPDPAMIGRNTPCPCGSGKRYKKCCRPGDTARREDELRSLREDIERLDGWSNGVLDAIDAGNHDEAEHLCENLLTQYPDQIDGHQRMAALREAQGRLTEAADAYDRALAHIERYPRGFDHEMIDHLRKNRDRVLEQLEKSA